MWSNTTDDSNHQRVSWNDTASSQIQCQNTWHICSLIPSPVELAKSVDNAALKSVVLNHSRQEVKEEEAIFAEYLGNTEVGSNNSADQLRQHGQEETNSDDMINVRRRVITFGDQKTCSNIRL